MPDSNNLPTVLEIESRLLAIQEDASESTLAMASSLLSSVVAHFQSPPGQEMLGGTGRQFVPVTETRIFDGNNLPQIRVDDIVPGAALAVSVFGTLLSDVLVKRAAYGQGYNILHRPQGVGFYNSSAYAIGGVFPVGIGNISVTTTWAVANRLTDDIREAILGEVCYQVLVRGEIGLNGVGEDITLEGFELNTSVGAINFTTTSPLMVMHSAYLSCVDTYRVSKMVNIKRFVRVMS